MAKEISFINFGDTMKNKPYRVTGDQQNGHRIAVQEGHGVKKGDCYDFRYYEESGNVYLPVGSLVYVPVRI